MFPGRRLVWNHIAATAWWSSRQDTSWSHFGIVWESPHCQRFHHSSRWRRRSSLRPQRAIWGRHSYAVRNRPNHRNSTPNSSTCMLSYRKCSRLRHLARMAWYRSSTQRAINTGHGGRTSTTSEWWVSSSDEIEYMVWAKIATDIYILYIYMLYGFY